MEESLKLSGTLHLNDMSLYCLIPNCPLMTCNPYLLLNDLLLNDSSLYCLAPTCALMMPLYSLTPTCCLTTYLYTVKPIHNDRSLNPQSVIRMKTLLSIEGRQEYSPAAVAEPHPLNSNSVRGGYFIRGRSYSAESTFHKNNNK